MVTKINEKFASGNTEYSVYAGSIEGNTEMPGIPEFLNQ